MTLTTLLKRAEKLTIDNSPLILTAIGVTGSITTAYLTGKASFEAVYILHQESRMTEERFQGDFPIKEQIKLVWKEYIPAAASGTLTVAAIIFANRIGNRRAAAMAAAFTLSERAFEEYQEKVVEKLGENKERKVRDEIAQDRVNNNPVGKHEVIITNGGDVLCYDTYTGRYFHSDVETLKKAQNDINYRILNDTYASLNDFYNAIGLANIKTGEEVGWNSARQLELIFSTTMSDDQRPCISIEFSVIPVRDYYKLH